LKKVGVDAKLVDLDDIGTPDILLFEAMGPTFENEVRVNKYGKRLKKIIEYMMEKPFVLVRHSVADRNVFKHSFSFFENFDWDLIVSVTDLESFLSLVKEEHKFERLVHIDHAFEFDDRRFTDKSEYKNTILSPTRIASCKRTHLVLDIAKALYDKKRFFIAGREEGIYWYRVIKEHPNKAYATFVGEYENVDFLYQKSAFALDMTCLYRNGRVQSCKQFTLLESIDCGSMPIIFDNWKREGEFRAIWLPLPERKGRSIIFDVERYVEIIKNSKYDFEITKEDRELLKKKHDLEKIGNQYKEEFVRLLK